MDFVRQIVNPVLNKYMTSLDASRVLGEVKRLFQQGEDTYRFSVYNGDPRNIAVFLRSDIFTRIVDILESSGFSSLLTEILVETKKSYGDIKEVEEAVDEVLSRLKTEKGRVVEVDPLQTIESMLRNTGLFKSVELGGGRLTAETDTGWILQVTRGKKGYRVKAVFTRSYSRGKTSELIGEVVRLAEWISSLRL